MEQEVFFVWYHDNYANDFYKRFASHAEAELAAEKYNRNEEGHACVITEDDYESMIENEGPMPWQKPGMSIHDFF